MSEHERCEGCGSNKVVGRTLDDVALCPLCAPGCTAGWLIEWYDGEWHDGGFVRQRPSWPDTERRRAVRLVRVAPASGEPSGAEAVVREEDGVALIAAERRRQVTEKGWTAAHDDAHRYGELAKVAAVLAVHCTDARVEDPDGWDSASDPWRIIEKTQAKTKNAGEAHRRLLTIAGALIAAEIDRLQRLPTAPGAPEEGAGE